MVETTILRYGCDQKWVGKVVCQDLNDKLVYVKKIDNKILSIKLELEKLIVDIISMYTPQVWIEQEN